MVRRTSQEYREGIGVITIETSRHRSTHHPVRADEGNSSGRRNRRTSLEVQQLVETAASRWCGYGTLAEVTPPSVEGITA